MNSESCDRMSEYKHDEPMSRHDPNGRFRRKCPTCGHWFRTDSYRYVYCSFIHKQQQNNRDFYRQHRLEIIAGVLKRKRDKK